MLPSKRFDQASPFVVLGLVLLGWLLVPAVVKVFTRSAFFEVQAPLTVADSYAADLQNFWGSAARPRKDLMLAGRDLARLAASYELRLQEAEQLEAEVLRLENLLSLPPQPAHRYEPARIARRDLTGWWQRLVVRKGRNYGITVGAPVVFAGGVVGRVVEVHAYTAVVDLVTSPTFRLAAAVEGDTRPLSYQGGLNDTLATPRGLVEFVPTDIQANAAEPKRLVTSGLGGVFPPGLTIGEIISLDPSTDGLFKSGEVRLDERLGSLTEVTILVPLNPELTP